MTLYVLRRLLLLVVSAVVASIAVFGFLAVLPGDPAQISLGVQATPEAIEAQRREFGTDRPLVVQYLSWAGGLLQGDFGVSYVSRAEIGPQIAERAGVSFWLVLGSTVVALLIALPAGTLAAVHHRNAFGFALSGLSQVGIAVPAFLGGILLVFVFAVSAGALPAGGYAGIDEGLVEWFRHLLLPWLALGLAQGAVLTRYVRSSVLTVLHLDFVRTARSKGRGRTGALARHGLRNAAVPVVTILGLQLANLIVGAVVVERVFVIPGLGDLLLRGVADRDLLLVQGVVLLVVLAVLVLNFVTDLAYHLIDPTLRAPR